jgi:hypothetical protein
MSTTLRTRSRWLCRIVSLVGLLAPLCAQNGSPNPTTAASAPAGVTPSTPAPPAITNNRVFGILPNNRTVDASLPFHPLTTKEKWTIAAKDSFDWTLTIVAGGLAGLGQMTNQNPRLGQGMAGYGNRFVRSYADQVMANLLVEGALPVALHEDPRYFRLGHGSFWGRTRYAASRTFVTRTDSGSWRFNSSEIFGNAIAVGISNAYYPGTRTFRDNSERYTIQIGIDAFSNVLKEFWPDMQHKFLHHDPK